MIYSKCKFKVEKTFTTLTSIKGFNVESEYSFLNENGMLLTRYGYTWDGASGAIDTPSMIKASCIHDQFCEWINEGKLPKSVQKIADKCLIVEMEKYWQYISKYGTLKQRSKEWFLKPFAKGRRKWVYRAVRIYQANKSKAPQKEILEVP